MYIDKMIEYLILSDILNDVNEEEIATGIFEREYNLSEMAKRYNELKREFLEPYAIESDLKE